MCNEWTVIYCKRYTSLLILKFHTALIRVQIKIVFERTLIILICPSLIVFKLWHLLPYFEDWDNFTVCFIWLLNIYLAFPPKDIFSVIFRLQIDAPMILNWNKCHLKSCKLALHHNAYRLSHLERSQFSAGKELMLCIISESLLILSLKVHNWVLVKNFTCVNQQLLLIALIKCS